MAASRRAVGQALLEAAVYDKDTGQLVSGSYMDYTMPRAENFPSFKLGYKVTPCPHNPLGVKRLRRSWRDRPRRLPS